MKNIDNDFLSVIEWYLIMHIQIYFFNNLYMNSNIIYIRTLDLKSCSRWTYLIYLKIEGDKNNKCNYIEWNYKILFILEYVYFDCDNS